MKNEIEKLKDRPKPFYDCSEVSNATISDRVSTIAERLTYYLKTHNLRQKDIAEMCKPYCEQYNIRIGTNDISQYVRGVANPNPDRLAILSKALGVNEIWLLGYNLPQQIPEDILNGMSDISILDKSEFDFVLEADDDSLFADHIFKGDVVFFRKDISPESGDLVAVMMDGKAMIRRVYFHIYDGIMVFCGSDPLNSILVYEHDTKVAIIGKAVAIMSKKINLSK